MQTEVIFAPTVRLAHFNANILRFSRTDDYTTVAI